MNYDWPNPEPQMRSDSDD